MPPLTILITARTAPQTPNPKPSSLNEAALSTPTRKKAKAAWPPRRGAAQREPPPPPADPSFQGLLRGLSKGGANRIHGLFVLAPQPEGLRGRDGTENADVDADSCCSQRWEDTCAWDPNNPTRPETLKASTSRPLAITLQAHTTSKAFAVRFGYNSARLMDIFLGNYLYPVRFGCVSAAHRHLTVNSSIHVSQKTI